MGNGKNTTTIEVSKAVKAKLFKLKIIPREAYTDVLERLLKESQK